MFLATTAARLIRHGNSQCIHAPCSFVAPTVTSRAATTQSPKTEASVRRSSARIPDATSIATFGFSTIPEGLVLIPSTPVLIHQPTRRRSCRLPWTPLGQRLRPLVLDAQGVVRSLLLCNTVYRLSGPTQYIRVARAVDTDPDAIEDVRQVRRREALQRLQAGPGLGKQIRMMLDGLRTRPVM